ncbi:MAG: hypothetical protein PWK00_09435, partial [Coxiella burnetii]|nr:hypothetical protein [Coxiella burnetii]
HKALCVHDIIESLDDHVYDQYTITSPTVLIRALKLERLSNIPRVSKKAVDLGFGSKRTPEFP